MQKIKCLIFDYMVEIWSGRLLTGFIKAKDEIDARRKLGNKYDHLRPVEILSVRPKATVMRS